MDTLADYLAASPAERNAFMRSKGEPTHYGTPIPRALEGYRVAMRKIEGRTPTHRGEPRNG